VVVPDHPAQAALEGECQQLVGTAAASAIGPSLGELCADPVLAEPLRHRLTVFDSTGFALEDHVALDVLLAVADELALGAEVQFEHHPSDVVNPYSAITG
jgi:ornithine cyclodeaminase/alanine dehydrogenase-like protein (mu-crystallin family)